MADGEPLHRWSPRHTLPKCDFRSEEHTSELQSQSNLVCRLLLEKKKTKSRCAKCCYLNPSSSRYSGPLLSDPFANRVVAGGTLSSPFSSLRSPVSLPSSPPSSGC